MRTISTYGPRSHISATTPGEQYDNAQRKFGRPPWGNCLRGCPPSYLDREGFCSPACKLGAPRGEYVTSPPVLTKGNTVLLDAVWYGADPQ